MIPEYLSWEPIVIALGLGCIVFGLTFLAFGFWFVLEFSGGRPRD